MRAARTTLLGAAFAGVALSTACGQGGAPDSGATPTAPSGSSAVPPGSGGRTGLPSSPPGPGGPTGPVGPVLPSGHPSPPGAPTVHDLGPADTGKTVTVAVGDRLLIRLPADKLVAPWALTAYPRGALAADLASTPVGGFGFVARASGSGRIVLTRSGCGPAGACPSGSAIPKTPLTWTAVVVVR